MIRKYAVDSISECECPWCGQPLAAGEDMAWECDNEWLYDAGYCSKDCIDKAIAKRKNIEKDRK
jgi:hypothetical protein